MENQPEKYCNRKGTGGVSLWDTLAVMTFGSALGGALWVVLNNPTLKGYFWTFASFLIGIAGIWLIRSIDNLIAKIISKKYENIALIFLYIFSVVWLFISSILGFLGSKI